jgi:peptide/nickel transport system substrate-binding protein
MMTIRVASLVAALVVATLAASTALAQDAAERRGALVDQIVITQEPDVGKVAGLIETGSHHVFAQGVGNPTVYQRLRDSERAALDLSYGSSVELTINPVGPEFATGALNPFHSPEIREALNWLIDRRYIAEEIYGGLAVPRFLPLSTAFPDYARLADVARAIELVTSTIRSGPGGSSPRKWKGSAPSASTAAGSTRASRCASRS